MSLFVGQRVTLLKIDDCLAMTHRYELEIRKALEPEAVGYEKRQTRLAVIRQRGKRKEFFLDVRADDKQHTSSRHAAGMNRECTGNANTPGMHRECKTTTSHKPTRVGIFPTKLRNLVKAIEGSSTIPGRLS